MRIALCSLFLRFFANRKKLFPIIFIFIYWWRKLYFTVNVCVILVIITLPTVLAAQFVSCDLCHEILTNLFQTIISKELFIENPKVLSAWETKHQIFTFPNEHVLRKHPGVLLSIKRASNNKEDSSEIIKWQKWS